jgi:hypothetical protein
MQSHFELLRPIIKEHAITKHFKRDMGGVSAAAAIALDVLDSNHEGFEELHKYEENIEGNHIFRAKIRGTHIVYAVTKDYRLVFLRGFTNYDAYKKFLEEKKKILSSLS